MSAFHVQVITPAPMAAPMTTSIVLQESVQNPLAEGVLGEAVAEEKSGSSGPSQEPVANSEDSDSGEEDDDVHLGYDD